ncbi:transketolase [Pectinatus frisingensis]|uniref:transketolase n=1 Tax=Pectinatus frisingensis TaxID=865 RepID=UPI0018C7BE4F|nr:transketolase [Pectinatus frisingensis]
MDITDLTEVSRRIRLDTIKAIYHVKTGHPGGALSIADILAVLYFNELNIDVQNPAWPDRDRFILSKGHGCTSLYAALAEKGFFQKEKLLTLRQYGSILQGHPDMKSTPGLDMSSGSLGQGLSIGNGMALAAKLQNKSYRVYVLLGDGELEEGQIWEAAMTASKYHLDNLIAIIDANGLQINGPTDEVMQVEPIDKKFSAFGWNTIVIDGNAIPQILTALKKVKRVKNKPSVIIAKTIKGKGISYMENNIKWHSGVPNPQEYKTALQELEGEL